VDAESQKVIFLVCQSVDVYKLPTVTLKLLKLSWKEKIYI